MNFLVDAQLPRRIAFWLQQAGQDAVHTLDLPQQNRTSDARLLEIAAQEQRVIVTKDADFVISHLLNHRPEKLLLISTGNVSNADLEALLVPQISALVAAFTASDFIELTRTSFIVHS